MSTPHKATERQWGIVRRRAENDDSTDSGLLEVVDRLAALERDLREPARTAARAGIDHEQRITALENASQATTGESSAVAPDHVCDAPQIVGPGLYMAEAASDRVRLHPVAPDHFRGAPGMVATDEELCSLYDTRRLQARSTIAALRAVYNLGRQHEAEASAAQPRQEEEAAPSPAPVTTDTRDPECVERWPDCHSGGYDPRCCRFPKSCSCGGDPPATEPAPSPTYELTDVAPLLWVLWRHLGAGSPVGQPIRRYLGMEQHDRMTPEQIEAATRWAGKSLSVQNYLDSIQVYGSGTARPTPPPIIDALIKAECALADIAEEQPNTSESDALKWAEQRCTATLAIIRPVMRQHGITTSEWPPAAEPTPPPAPAGDPVAVPSELVERVLRRLPSGTDSVFARQAILEIAEWADEEGLFRTRRRLREEAHR